VRVPASSEDKFKNWRAGPGTEFNLAQHCRGCTTRLTRLKMVSLQRIREIPGSSSLHSLPEDDGHWVQRIVALGRNKVKTRGPHVDFGGNQSVREISGLSVVGCCGSSSVPLNTANRVCYPARLMFSKRDYRVKRHTKINVGS
jgi:hypothetical protein